MLTRRSVFGAIGAFLGFVLTGRSSRGGETGRKADAKLTKVTAQLLPQRLHVPTTSPKLRVWKLGSLEHRIFPTEKALQRLADVLRQWDGESDLDLIWGPELEVTQFDLGPGEKTMDVIVEPGGHEVDGRKVLLRKPLVTIRDEQEGEKQ